MPPPTNSSRFLIPPFSSIFPVLDQASCWGRGYKGGEDGELASKGSCLQERDRRDKSQGRVFAVLPSRKCPPGRVSGDSLLYVAVTKNSSVFSHYTSFELERERQSCDAQNPRPCTADPRGKDPGTFSWKDFRDNGGQAFILQPENFLVSGVVIILISF